MKKREREASTADDEKKDKADQWDSPDEAKKDAPMTKSEWDDKDGKDQKENGGDAYKRRKSESNEW